MSIIIRAGGAISPFNALNNCRILDFKTIFQRRSIEFAKNAQISRLVGSRYMHI